MKSNFATKVFLVCGMLFLFFSHEKEGHKPKPLAPYKAGVVLTFDDAYVAEWVAMDKQMRPYSWKATFCVSNINSLSLSEINGLLALKTRDTKLPGIACIIAMPPDLLPNME